MSIVTISDAGAHEAVAATDRLPASKAGEKGYHTVAGLVAFGRETYTASAAGVVGQRLSYRTQTYEYEFDVVSDHTSDANPLVDYAAGRLRLISEGPRNARQLTYPVGYSGPQIDVFLRGDGKVTTEYDNDQAFRNAFMVLADNAGAAGDKVFWVSPNGDNTDGTTPAKAYSTIASALAEGAVLTIMIEGGYTYGGFSGGLTKSVNIIAYGDKPAIIAPYDRSPTIGVNSTYDNVYDITESTGVWQRPASGRVRDKYGVPVGYTEVASVEEVSNTPLSYYRANNTLIHVHASAEPTLNEDIFLTLDGWKNSLLASANANADTQVYLEGLVFAGGLRALSTSGGKLHCLRCAAIGGHNTDPWTISGIGNVVLNQCIGAYARGDAFSYETSGDLIELNCIAYSNGDAGGSVQASSAHSACNILRVGGLYECAAQNAILDVGTGHSMNIGVTATGGPTSSCFGVGATREMWNVLCRPAGDGNHYLCDSSVDMKVDGSIRGIITAGSGDVVLDDAV